MYSSIGGTVRLLFAETISDQCLDDEKWKAWAMFYCIQTAWLICGVYNFIIFHQSQFQSVKCDAGLEGSQMIC